MMTVMTQYVNGEKPYTFLELKGAVEFASLMLENTYKGEDNSSSNQENKTEAVQDNYCPDRVEITNSDDVEIKTENVDKSSESNTNIKTSSFNDKKWRQNFVDEVVEFAHGKLIEKKNITQKDMILLFEKQFLDRVPDNDKIKVGNARAKYVEKLHKTIYNNLILEKKAEFNNGIYNIVKQNSA